MNTTPDLKPGDTIQFRHGDTTMTGRLMDDPVVSATDETDRVVWYPVSADDGSVYHVNAAQIVTA